MHATSFAKSLHMGGSDTGGGSGLIINNQLILQDFKNCPVIDTDKKYPVTTEVISSSVEKLNASQIAKIIENNPKFSSEIFKKLMITSAMRANWYLVDANLLLDSPEKEKLAIFKRPLGILINKNLFNQLSNVNQQGLFFHETLRMLSIGLGFDIESSTLETLTCQAYSEEKSKINLDLYLSLNNFITNWMKLYTDAGYSSSEATTAILERLENSRRLDDINFPLLVPNKYNFLYQGNVSKFEKLRNVVPFSKYDFLEQAFFSWAAVEAPTLCYSLKDCHYFEQWPSHPNQIISPIEKWNLFYNNEMALGWATEDEKLSIVISKGAFSRNFCTKISLLMNDNYKLINPRSDINKITDHNLDYIIKRTNLDYFDEIELLQFNRPICIKVN